MSYFYFKKNESRKIMTDKKNVIKAGYLISYDYSYIFSSVKLIYDHVDSIVISYDADNKTWAGNDILIPESFFSEVKAIDIHNKITFYKDQFYVPNIQSMELETRQRNMMAEKMGSGGWHIQIDSDEYAYDFKLLAQFLRKHQFLTRKPEKTPINFLVNLVVLFKQNKEGFYVIQPFNESCFLITNNPIYEKARKPKVGKTLQLDYYLIHQSWARTPTEIEQKIKNWGHKNDFDVQEFYEKWRDLDETSYKNYIDFHPLPGSFWGKLDFFEATNIQDFIEKFEQKHPQKKLYLNLSFTRKIKLYIRSLF